MPARGVLAGTSNADATYTKPGRSGNRQERSTVHSFKSPSWTNPTKSSPGWTRTTNLRLNRAQLCH